MVISALSLAGAAGLVVLGLALVALLISVLHPEALRRPGGFLDGRDPGPPEISDR